MNEQCETCKFWQLDNEDRTYLHPIVFPYHPGKDFEQCQTEEEVVAAFGYRVRYCTNPKIVFYQRPEINAATVVDGSEYRAALLTAEKFGCVLHEPLS